MKNLFAKLVARAWDTAPRAHPELAPRFAPRAAESWAVGEIDAEVDAAPPRRAPAGPPAPEIEGRARQAPRAEAPVFPRAMRDFAPVRGLEVPPPATRTVERGEGEEPNRPAPSPRGFEREDVGGARPIAAAPRAMELPVARPPEHTHDVPAAAPVAARPPLRTEDVAVLRSAPLPRTEGARVAGEPSRSVRLSPPPAAAGEAPAPIEISIGRIDVRAVPAAPPVAPRSPAAAPVALPLHEYLRRRQDGR
jgi:hypothetical protein